MNASCNNVRELIPLFPNDLDSNEARLVREHVAGCNPCAAELGIFAAQAACFAQVREGRAKLERGDLFAGIQEKLARPAPAAPIISFSFAARVLVGAAAAGVVVAIGLFAFSQKGAPAQPEPLVANNKPEPKAPEKNDVKTPEQGITNITPEQKHGRKGRTPRRHFQQEDAMPWGPIPFGVGGGMPVIERELTPLDEEAEIPQTHSRKKTFAAPQSAVPNKTPKSSEEDSLRF
jgi:hypothetical protein